MHQNIKDLNAELEKILLETAQDWYELRLRALDNRLTCPEHKIMAEVSGLFVECPECLRCAIGSSGAVNCS